jgi:hypothetical protein
MFGLKWTLLLAANLLVSFSDTKEHQHDLVIYGGTCAVVTAAV